VKKLKDVWLNKYKIYLLSLSLFGNNYERIVYSTHFQSRKPKTQKQSLRCFQKYATEKLPLLKKSASKSSPFSWDFRFWEAKLEP